MGTVGKNTRVLCLSEEIFPLFPNVPQVVLLFFPFQDVSVREAW